MLTLKNLLLIASPLIFLSCSTSKNEQKALYVTIRDLKTPIYKHTIDTIEIVENTIKLDIQRLKGYKMEKEIALNHTIFSSGGNYEWTDKKNAWTVGDSEIDDMLVELSNQKNMFWSNSKIQKGNPIIKFVELPRLEDYSVEDIERHKRIKNDKFVYIFTKPIFNKKRDTFFIEYEILLLPYSKTTLIYKKENGNWNKIASLSQPW